MNARLAAALRALRGEPGALQVAASKPPPEDPVDAAIATLLKTPIAEIQRRGYHFQPRDYYSALNDLPFLEENPDLWHDRGLPLGVEWDLRAQLRVLERVAPYSRELMEVPDEMPPGEPRYHWRNDFWNGLDALVHYGILRDIKPGRVVEIGCGWSSLLMAQALSRNEDEGTPPATVDQVEPHARQELLRALPGHWTLHETILQRAPLGLFEQLGDGDVCFYDGSHVARAGSDVNWFFFEVIPRLAPGVIIHVHDIFWPNDYPDQWLFEGGLTWNEQYLFQAFLMYNAEFEPLIANAAVALMRSKRVAELLGALPTTLTGGSVWMRSRPSSS